MSDRNAKLKDFPLFMSGCKAIAADSGCHHGPHAHNVNPNAETREYTEAITYIEVILAQLAEKTVAEFIPELPDMDGYEDISPDENVLEFVFLGMNDSMEIILTKAGLAPHEVWLVGHVFDQFFEGELHERFTMPVSKRNGNGHHKKRISRQH